MTIFSVVDQVLVLFLLIGIGWILSARRFVDQAGVRQMTNILCYLVSPCLIVNCFQMNFTASAAHSFLLAALSAVGIHLCSALLGTALFRKKKLGERAAAMRFAVTYSNCGFMGLPLLQAVAGQMGVFLGVAYVGVFNLFNWTHGISVYRGRTGPSDLRKAVLNPNIIALAVSLVLFFNQITLPSPLRQGISYVSQMNTALSMILVGTQLAEARIGKLVGSFPIWATVFLRNLLLPFALLAVLVSAGLRGSLLMCCVVPVACPIASYTAIFAELTGRETKVPVALVTLSTLFSMVTLPAVVTAAAAFSV